MLRVLKPYTITPAMLVSSTAADAFTAYAAGTTYALGAKVTHEGATYESLQGANTGHTPGLSPTWWLYIGASNRMAMFDRKVGSVTTAAGALTATVLPDDIVTDLAVLSAVGSSVTATMTHPTAGVVYTATKAIGGSMAADFWEYCFGDKEVSGELVFAGLPPYFGAQITVTVESSSTASCGSLLLGRQHEIGRVEFGAEFGIDDYSVKGRDAFGNADVVERDYSRDASYSVRLPRAEARRVDAFLSSVRATPCLYIGDEDTDALSPLMAYGYFESFRTVVAYAQEFVMSLEVKGLT